MNKYLLIIGGVLGIIGGILAIISGIMGKDFPKPLLFVVAICLILNAAANIVNYRNAVKNKEKDIPKDSD